MPRRINDRPKAANKKEVASEAKTRRRVTAREMSREKRRAAVKRAGREEAPGVVGE